MVFIDLNFAAIEPTNGLAESAKKAIILVAFSAVNDGVCKHSPCPLITTTGARRRRECKSAL